MVTVKGNYPFLAFNAGEIGKEVQGRITIENYAATSDIMENYLPTSEGPMVAAPGGEFYSELPSMTYLKSFVFNLQQKYLLGFSDDELRIIQDGAVLFRPDVDCAVTNGDFASATGWTDISTGAASRAVSGGNLVLDSNGSDTAGARQEVATSSPNVLHALRIVVDRGPVNFRCGSAAGLDDYVRATSLNKGVHSLAFTPTGASFFIDFTSSLDRQIIIDSCTIEDEGDLVIPTPWLASDFDTLRFKQSRDVMYVVSGSTAKRRIERRSANSWSLAYSDEKDGPFEAPNTDGSLSLTPSVTTGNGTLTASKGFFRSGHAGALFAIGQSGQSVSSTLTAENQFTSAIRVTGVGNDRIFTWAVAGSFIGTVRLQRSVGDDTNFVDFDSTTVATSQTENDELPNQIIYYRIGIKAGEWGTYDEEEISSEGTEIGTSPSSGSLAALFDGVTNIAYASSVQFASATASYAGRTLADGRRITRAVVHGSNNQGFVNGSNPSVTLRLYGKTGSAPGSATDGTIIGTLTFTDTSNESGGRTITSTDTETSYDHVWVTVVTAASVTQSLGEVRLFGFSNVLTPGGSVDVSLSYAGGATTGICRVTSVASSTSANMEVIEPFANTGASTDWQQGSWSDELGHPTAIDIFDGRLWQANLDRAWGSVSDLYESQKAGSGDSDAIAVSIGTSNIKAMMGLSRLIVLTESAENVIRSSAFDEPVTPSNLTRREMSSYGVGNCAPLRVDSRGLFLDRSEIHLMEMVYDVDIQDYVANPLTRLHRDIGRPGIDQVTVARRPETRLYAVRSDGQLLTKLYSPSENVFGWGRINRSGLYRSVEMLPGDVGEGEDEIWMTVERRVENQRRYYLEKMGPLYWPSKADASIVDSFLREDQPLLSSLRFYGATTLARGADFSTNADGKEGIISFMVRLTGDDDEAMFVYASEGPRFRIERTTGGKWLIRGQNSAGDTILELVSEASYGQEAGWHHVLASWDLANGVGELYINDVDDLADGAVLTDDTIDYTRSDHYIAHSAGSGQFQGEIAALYVNLAEYIDITDEDVRRRFVAPASLGDADETVIWVPVWLDSDGAYPTSSQPILYLYDDAASGNVNRGTGGNLTATGTLWDGEPHAPCFMSQSTVMTGFDHLIGETVTVISDGVNIGEYEVDGDGEIDTGQQAMKRVGGLKYRSRYRSSALALGGQLGTGFAQQAEAEHIVIALVRSSNVLRYGTDFNGDMDDLSGFDMSDAVIEGGLITGISEQLTVPGHMRRDPRICVESWAEPVSIQAIVLSHKTNEQT
jgi:hypothetical protein